jgi:hypothetical protein
MRVRVWLLESDETMSAGEQRDHVAGGREEGHSSSLFDRGWPCDNAARVGPAGDDRES